MQPPSAFELTLASAVVRNTTDTVFISGSREVGFGNDLSDYDVYLLRDSDIDSELVAVVLDGIYVDYEMHSFAHAHRVISSINSAQQQDSLGIWRIPPSHIDFYYKTLTARALVNVRDFEQLRAHCSHAVINAVTHRWHALRSASALEHGQRQLALGHARTAYLATRKALDHALDSFLGLRGESYPSAKWRYDKLRRCLATDDDILRSAWRLKSLGTHTYESYIQAASALCAVCGVQRGHGWSLDHVVYRKDARLDELSLGTARFVIHNKTTAYQLTPSEHVILKLVDGTIPRREVLQRSSVHGVSEDEFDGVIARLLNDSLIAE